MLRVLAEHRFLSLCVDSDRTHLSYARTNEGTNEGTNPCNG